MRAIWKGTISFGLVSIPIKLYSAVEQQSLGFRLLCKKCKTPVRYEKHCEGCGGPLQQTDIIKGLEIGNGEYITFTDEELDRLRPKKTDRIEIKEFIDTDELDPIYYDKPYFCGPQRQGDRAYFLFREVLLTSGKQAIGRFVMREKQYVCAVRTYKDGLLLSTLNYGYEIRDINTIKELQEPPKLSKEELNLAVKLVDQLYAEEFDIGAFKDTFAEQLREAVKNKDVVRQTAKPKQTKRPRESTLMDALKASLK